MMRQNSGISKDTAIAAAKYTREEEYWLEQLHGELNRSCIPYDSRNRSAGKEPTGLIPLEFVLPGELFDRLVKLSNGVDYTMHITLTALVTLLLHKYTAGPDITVGVPIYKQESDTEFINTVLPIRSSINGKMTFKELLLQARQTIIDAEAHQNYPIEILFHRLDIPPVDNKDDYPLFDTAVLMESIHDKKYISHIRINMIYYFIRESMTCIVEYNPAAYAGETIERMTRRFLKLLNDCLFNTAVLLNELELITEEEKKQLLYDFNDTYEEYDRDKTIVQLFEEQVLRTPHRIAAECTNEQISYRELNNSANHRALVLRLRGISPHTIAAIIEERSIAMVVNIMAVLKAGGAYMPVNPETPKRRLASLLNDASVSLVLARNRGLRASDPMAFTQGKIAEPGICRQVVLFDESAQESGSQFSTNIDNIEPINQVDDPAYVIFTSGSTGEPKGSIIPHGNVAHLIHGLKQRIYKDYPGSLKIAQAAPYFFDASIKQVFAALLQGYCLSIVPDETRGDGRLLAEYYARNAVDVSDCTPTHLYLLMESSSTGKLNFPIKRFIIGGEPLLPKIAADFLKCFSAHTPTLTNIYGVTECTVDSTSYTIDPNNIPPYDTVPIGKPMSNSHIYILDRENRLQPIGVAGELCIAGHGVGTGYLNRPELTHEKFVFSMQGGSFRENHPPAKALDKSFLGVQGAILQKSPLVAEGNYLYKTGDLARWRPDGNIEFVGRADFQVKIRGYRLELGEIENNLLKHPDVGQAIVLAKTDQDGDNFLCAYAAPKTTAKNDEQPALDEQGFSASIREFLSAVMPAYMIPTYIIPLREIPLTPNGKINRRALPEPRVGDGGAAYLAPRTPVEEKLVRIWADVLKTEPGNIGIDADFFEMGGHSLRATIMVSRIHKMFDTRIPLQKIFEKPTIRGIAAFIGESVKEKFANIPCTEKREYYPLSSSQRRLYVVQQMDEEIASYTTLMVVIVHGQLNVDRLRAAFAGLFERHDSLRTYFEVIDGQSQQRIAEQISLHLEQYTMTEEQGVEFAQKTFSRPFDLSKPPLIRVGLIKIEETRRIMAISIHHIIADGSSVGMLMREFMQIYEEKPLTPLRLRYVDYSRQQNSKEQKEAVRRQERYWLEQFEKEVPKLNLPTDFPRPPIRKFSGSNAGFRIQPEETKRIKELAAQEDVTLYMFLLAVFNVFLFKITGQEDILVGTPAANRRHTDLENIIGMFANIIVMRNSPARQRSFRSFLKEIRQRTLQAFDNQDYKLEDLVEQVVKEKDLSRHPLFDVLFSLQNMEFPRIKFSDLSMEQLEHTLWAARTDLVFVAFELPDAPEIDVLVEYNTPLFKAETIRAFIADFKTVLAAILADPDTRLLDIEISAPAMGNTETDAARLRELDLGF